MSKKIDMFEFEMGKHNPIVNASLTKLKYIALDNNLLKGMIPMLIGSLIKFFYLSYEGNTFKGSKHPILSWIVDRIDKI